MLLQSHTLQAPLKHELSASEPPASAWVAANWGSLSAMLAWMLSVTWMPCCLAQVRNACGSGNREGFHSQPFQSLGDFQLVSTDRVSRGT
jgi:hypothetical protein